MQLPHLFTWHRSRLLSRSWNHVDWKTHPCKQCLSKYIWHYIYWYIYLFATSHSFFGLTVDVDYDFVIISVWMTADLQAHNVWQVHSFLTADPTKQNLERRVKNIKLVNNSSQKTEQDHSQPSIFSYFASIIAERREKNTKDLVFFALKNWEVVNSLQQNISTMTLARAWTHSTQPGV